MRNLQLIAIIIFIFILPPIISMYASTAITNGCVNEITKNDTINLNIKIEKQKL